MNKIIVLGLAMLLVSPLTYSFDGLRVGVGKVVYETASKNSFRYENDDILNSVKLSKNVGSIIRVGVSYTNYGRPAMNYANTMVVPVEDEVTGVMTNIVANKIYTHKSVYYGGFLVVERGYRFLSPYVGLGYGNQVIYETSKIEDYEQSSNTWSDKLVSLNAGVVIKLHRAFNIELVYNSMRKSLGDWKNGFDDYGLGFNYEF